MVLIFLSIVSAAAAGLAGFAGRQYLRLSSVQASAAVALLAGLILPWLHGEGAYLAAVCACASYAAMSSEKVIAGPLQMAAVASLCGLLMYVGQGCLTGVGGRLGTFAALAVLTFTGWQFMVKVSAEHFVN